MKRLVLAAAAALTLTACATNQEAYYMAIAEREKRQAELEMRADTAIAQMAQNGDAQVKGMAIMYFANRANQAKSISGQGLQAPKSMAEQLLPWASLILPTITQLYTITKQTDVQIANIGASLEGKKIDNATHLEFGKLIEGPTLNADGDAVLWPR
jgi:hypothetical protein